MERIYNSKNEFTNWKIDGKGNEFPIECKAVIDASGLQVQHKIAGYGDGS